MKKIFAIFLTLFVCQISLAQSDTILLIRQKGFFFLSGYNSNYDTNKGEIKSFGFSDYFFPSTTFDEACLLDSNKIISFKNGIRLEVFKSRDRLKKKATKLNSTNLQCYFYDSFYVLPVIVDYRVFKDSWPFDCRTDFFNIDVLNGSKLIFYHERKAMLPIKITLIPSIKKRK